MDGIGGIGIILLIIIAGGALVALRYVARAALRVGNLASVLSGIIKKADFEAETTPKSLSSAEPGIVHRIDRDTSGLLAVAKNDLAHQGLAAQLADHSMFRVYEAVVCGRLREDSGTVNAPIGRHPVDRKRMAIVQRGGREALTHWEVLARYRDYTHVRCRLETGRTHQIRVHMESIGHPLAGDLVYGKKRPDKGLSGQCLHARTLELTHPRTGERMRFTTELPAYFTEFLGKLGAAE